MATFGAVYDACVLYPAPIRDLLIRLASTGLFRAHWTEHIHEEWIRTLKRQRPDIDDQKLDRLRRQIDSAVPDCLVTGYEPLIETLCLPDADDRHVLAAAIKSGASVIVTTNLKHFPVDELAKFAIEVQHPDEFVHHLCGLHMGAVVRVVREQRQDLKSPPKTVDEMLETFLASGLSETVSVLRPFSESL
jgi:predicted nucleic acid-binding protein